MANKKGMIMYYDVLEQLEDFNDKDFRQIIEAVIKYDKNGTLPDFEGEKKIAFKFIKMSIDRNNEQYNNICEKNRQNAQKRWSNAIEVAEVKEKKSAKQVKHKYGEYQHILLTDDELDRLKKDFGETDTQKAIKLLDEAIEMKGYKYKSHNLAIRKWVMQEVKKQKCSGGKSRDYTEQELNNAFTNLDEVEI